MLELRKHFVFVVLACAFAAPALAQQTPAGLKVALTGDQSLGSDPEEVLRFIKAEGAEALFIQGDFDYSDDPAAWEAMLDTTLGANFPVIALVGNHDEAAWYGAGGYQERLTQRMQRTGVPWLGELGVQATVKYKGLFVVQTAAGVFDGYDHAAFIRSSLAADASIWSISGWHKLMADMQVGGKGDETGWEVYEESRRGGAIIATAHEHSYSRTHLLSDMESRTVASTAQPLVLAADDTTTGADEGRSFAFVSGLGGSSIRDQERTGAWWASVYTATQGANNGALFAVFNVNNDPRLAHFYFKDVTGKVVDDFMVRSALGQAGPPPAPTTTTTTTVPATSTTTTTTAPATTSTTTTTPATASTTTTTTVSTTSTTRPAATSTTTTTVPAVSTSTTSTTRPAATSTTTTTVPAVSTSTTSTTRPAATSTTTTTVPAVSTSTTSTTRPAATSTTTTTVPAVSTSTTSTTRPAATSTTTTTVPAVSTSTTSTTFPAATSTTTTTAPAVSTSTSSTSTTSTTVPPTPGPAPTPSTACSDDVDNDGDRRIDYPRDKGCDSPDDPYEEGRRRTRRLLRKQGITLAPATTASLGACWDGLDNDGDERIDFPKDKGCDSPNDPYELNRPQTKRLLKDLE